MPRHTVARRRCSVLAGVAAAMVASTFTVAASAAVSETAVPPGALVLEASDASHGGWSRSVLHPHGNVRAPKALPGTLRLSDGGRPAGAVMLGVEFAPRSSVVTRAEVNLARQVLGKGRARPLLEVVSGQGHAVEAGVFRNRQGRLVWALWAKRDNGARHAVVVSSKPLRKRAWTRVTLVTHWNRAGGRAALRVDGKVVLRSPRIDRTGVVATRVSVGLGKASSQAEVGLMFVRNTLTWGTDAPPGSTPESTLQPITPGPAGSTPTGTTPTTTTPSTTTPTTPRTPTTPTTPTTPRTPTTPTTPSAPRPAPGPASPPPPPGTIPGTVFAAVDFQSGSFGGREYFGGINSYQAVASDRIQSVPSPDGNGRVGRFEVRQGDSPVSCCGNRAEVAVGTAETEGQERWYTWTTMFDESFPSAHPWNDYQVVSQFHSQQNGQPPVAFYAEGGIYRLQVWPKNSDASSAGPPVTIWSTTIQRGKWYRIALHVKWSGSDDIGFVELFVDGQPAGQKTQIRTMYPGYKNYFKMGYYRDADVPQTGVVYHDDFQASNVN